MVTHTSGRLWKTSLLDAVAGPVECAEELRVERTGLGGRRAGGGEDRVAEGGAAGVPLAAGGRRAVGGAGGGRQRRG